MAHVTAPRILVVGESLIDVVRRADGRIEEIPGGSPANVAITLGRLGRSPRLLTALGADGHGRVLRDWLAESGVEVAHAEIPRTATATAELDRTGAATYVFDIAWSLSGATAEDADVIHVGSIAGLLDPGADEVLHIVEAGRPGALVTYDPNIRPALVSDGAETRRRVESLVAQADVVKASDEDLHWLYPGFNPRDAARAWQASGPAVVIVTEGAKGAFAVADCGELEVPGRRVSVVDTVGAGDTFMGALIDGLISAGWADGAARDALRAADSAQLASILDWAARAAAVTVSRPGADPPRRGEVA